MTNTDTNINSGKQNERLMNTLLRPAECVIGPDRLLVQKPQPAVTNEQRLLRRAAFVKSGVAYRLAFAISFFAGAALSEVFVGAAAGPGEGGAC